MVAAGGGGGFISIQEGGNASKGGAGGGLNGYDANNLSPFASAYGYAMGATQTAGGICNPNYNLTHCRPGTFGSGGNIIDNGAAHSGGGGGYYGGAQSGHVDAAAGGSSFISGHNGCNAISSSSTESNIVHTGHANHYSGYKFTSTKMIDGNGYKWTNTKGSLEQMPNPSGGYYASGKGHSGNGYARITIQSTTNRYSYILKDKILYDNPTIKTNPTLSQLSPTGSDSGLYSLSVTNGFGGANGTTYYFRGDVSNNVVSFAGKLWRIVRINEDGTIRLILDTRIDSSTYYFNGNRSSYSYQYYSNSGSYMLTTLTNWYNNNIGNNTIYSSNVATGNYFCEAAKVTASSGFTSGNATLTLYNNYTPNLSCSNDGNSKGLVNTNIGLITYDEIIYAGDVTGAANNSYYIYKGINSNNNYNWWTMSPYGYSSGYAHEWYVSSGGAVSGINVDYPTFVRPVINLKANTKISSGTGTAADPYIVK